MCIALNFKSLQNIEIKIPIYVRSVKKEKKSLSYKWVKKENEKKKVTIKKLESKDS